MKAPHMLALANVGAWACLLSTSEVVPHNDAFVFGLALAIALCVVTYRDARTR